MFTNIEITQFRSCAGVNISDLRGITALAGRNGSGKTNTLRAIRWLAAMATGGDDSRGIGTVEGHREVSATIQLADTTFRYHVQHVSTQNGPELMESLVSDQIKVERNGEQVILDFHDEPLQIDLDAPCIPAIISLLPHLSEVDYLAQTRAFFSSVHYYALDEPHYSKPDPWGMIPGHRYEKWVSEQSTGRIESDVPIRLLHMSKERPEDFDEVVSLLGEDGLGLLRKISVHEVDLSEDESELVHLVRFTPIAQKRFGRGFSSLSAGTRRAVNLITSMVYDKSAVMLIEHPEDGIHGALLTKLLDILRVNCDPLQVFLTTHSTAVFDQLKAEEVRLVSMTEGETSVRSLSDQELTAASNFMQNDGSFSDFIETVQDD
jgi:predicted ATP-dependent endonuclease of OLD family